MAFKASDRRHQVEFTRNPVSSYFHSQVFIFMRLSSLALPWIAIFARKCDCHAMVKLTRNRANSNFHPQPAIVILAPICIWQRLVDDAIPKRTADSNSFWKSVFLTYCQSIGKTIDFSTVTAADLAPILESFFVDVRGKNGEPYKGNSLKAAKGAIQRLLSAKDRRINIFQDAEFDKMRKVFAGLLKDRRRSGEEASVLHKEPLTDADWKLLHAYFADAETTLDAIKLCRYVWFYVTLHFCFRGTEMQVALKKDALQFVSVENGDEIIKLNGDYMSKNHQEDEYKNAGCITDPVQVRVIRKYLSKLNPGIDRLFQRAKMNVSEGDACWYMRSPLGKNLLSAMLKTLSKEAKLSRTYTNHCLRASSITRLKQAGFDDRKIATVSGHKSLDSLKAYDRTSEAESRAMSAALDQDPARAPLKAEAYSASSRKSRKLYCVVSSSSRASCRGCSQCSWSTVRKPRLSLKLKRKRKDWCFLSLVHLSASEVFFASKKKGWFYTKCSLLVVRRLPLTKGWFYFV